MSGENATQFAAASERESTEQLQARGLSLGFPALSGSITAERQDMTVKAVCTHSFGEQGRECEPRLTVAATQNCASRFTRLDTGSPVGGAV